MSLLARFRLENAHGPSDLGNGPAAPASAGEGTDTRSDNSDRLFFPPSSPVCERSDSLEPPPPAQRRRERSDSAEAAFEQESLQRLKRHCATQVCRDFDLAEGSLDTFTELDVPGMLITIFGKIVWLERERTKDDEHSFIKSDEFKAITEILQDRLRAALLSANISHYLNGINNRIWAFIKDNLGVFNIKPPVMEDARLTMYIDALMKDVLTKQRSQIKTKMATSILKKNHMSDLAKSLAGRDSVDVTLAQWGRFSFLRQNYMLFNNMVEESLAKKVTGSNAREPDGDDNDSDGAEDRTRSWSHHQFWEFIDQLLDEMRESVREEPNTELRKAKWEKFFTDTLQTDLQRFPPDDKSVALRPSDGRNISDWQKAIHRHVAWL